MKKFKIGNLIMLIVIVLITFINVAFIKNIDLKDSILKSDDQEVYLANEFGNRIGKQELIYKINKECIKNISSLKEINYDNISLSKYKDTLYLFDEGTTEEKYLVCLSNLKFIFNKKGYDLKEAYEKNIITLDYLKEELEKKNLGFLIINKKYDVIEETTNEEINNEQETDINNEENNNYSEDINKIESSQPINRVNNEIKKDDINPTPANNVRNNSNNKVEKVKTNNEAKSSNSVQNVVIVKNENVDEQNITYIYGTSIIDTTTYNVTYYSDNTQNKNKLYTRKTYDRSTYNASINDLKGEASRVVSNNAGIYNEVLAKTNEYRASKGVEPLVLDSNLSYAATIRAMEMAYGTGLSHTRPNGQVCFTIFNDLGIASGWNYGENAAYGQATAISVTTSWANSPGHYENMVNADFTRMGVGMYEFIDGKYWIQLFST